MRFALISFLLCFFLFDLGAQCTIFCPADIITSSDIGICGAIVNVPSPTIGGSGCTVSNDYSGGTSGTGTYPVGITIVTWTVTDSLGGSSFCSHSISVQDIENPNITCPASIVVNNDSNLCGANVLIPQPLISDNCGIDTIYNQYNNSSDASDFYPIGFTSLTWFSFDEAGNGALCNMSISVQDLDPPNISCPADLFLMNDSGQCGATTIFADPVITDNCSGAILSQTGGQPSGSFFNIGTFLNSFTVTDMAGGTALCSQIITVIDAEPPVLDCPPGDSILDVDSSGGEVLTYSSPLGNDNCGVTLIATQTGGLGSGGEFPLGTTINSFEVSDSSGNMASCSFSVVVSAPTADTSCTITCPSDLTISNDSSLCGAVVDFPDPILSGGCAGASFSQTGGSPSGTFLNVGTFLNSFTVTDMAGGTALCSQIITVFDAEPPVLDCPPGDSILDADTSGGEVFTYSSPLGNDNCGGSLIATQTGGLGSGSEFPLGTTINSFEVSDSSGNMASCSFSVVVIAPPVDTSCTITCPSDLTVSNDSGLCGGVVDFPDPILSGGCAGASFSQTGGSPSGTFLNVGNFLNSFTLVDGAGGTSSCSQIVTVFDAEPPFVECPEDLLISNAPGMCEAKACFDEPIFSDNCNGVTISQVSGVGSNTLVEVGVYNQSFLATDNAGNSTSCSYILNVIDIESPSLDCPPTYSVIDSNSDGSEIVDFSMPLGFDNCDGTMIPDQAFGLSSGSPFLLGITINIFELTDSNGNEASCNFVVEVLPNGPVNNGSTAEKTDLSVYPNPFSDKLIVEIGNHKREYKLELIDVFGKIVLKSPETQQSRVSLDLTGLARGIYFVRFTDNNGKQTVKVEKK